MSNITNYLGYLDGEIAANDEGLPVGDFQLRIFGTRTATAIEAVNLLTLVLNNGSSYDISASGVSTETSATPSRRKLLQVGY